MIYFNLNHIFQANVRISHLFLFKSSKMKSKIFKKFWNFFQNFRKFLKIKIVSFEVLSKFRSKEVKKKHQGVIWKNSTTILQFWFWWNSLLSLCCLTMKCKYTELVKTKVENCHWFLKHDALGGSKEFFMTYLNSLLIFYSKPTLKISVDAI